MNFKANVFLVTKTRNIFHEFTGVRYFQEKRFYLVDIECYVKQIPASNYLHKDFTFILLSHLYIKSEHAFDVI